MDIKNEYEILLSVNHHPTPPPPNVYEAVCASCITEFRCKKNHMQNKM